MEIEQLSQVAHARALARSGAARTIREAAGVSLGELAGALGIAKSTLWRWEAGARSPRGDLAIDYAAALGRLMQRDGLDRPRTRQ